MNQIKIIIANDHTLFITLKKNYDQEQPCKILKTYKDWSRQEPIEGFIGKIATVNLLTQISLSFSS